MIGNETMRTYMPAPCEREHKVRGGWMPMGRRLAAIVFAIGTFLVCRGELLAADDAPPEATTDGLITVQIPYDVFMALVSYQDLINAEARGESVDSEMVDVLETMIGRLARIRKRYAGAQTPDGMRDDLMRRLDQLDRHLNDFRKELTYRRKVTELREKLQEQKALKSIP